jgi:hypothetical protein
VHVHLLDRLGPHGLARPGDTDGSDYSGRARTVTNGTALSAMRDSSGALLSRGNNAKVNLNMNLEMIWHVHSSKERS